MTTQNDAGVSVTGYQLQRALSHWETLRDLALAEFTGSLSAFPGEDKAGPDEVMTRIVEAELAIAALQTAQVRYNLQVIIPLGNSPITLTEAIKRMGGISRIEKSWRKSLEPQGGFYTPSEKKEGKIYSQPRLTLKELQSRTLRATRAAAELRQAISVANGSARVITVDPGLLSEEP